MLGTVPIEVYSSTVEARHIYMKPVTTLKITSLFIVYVGMVCVPWHICRGQRAAFGNRLVFLYHVGPRVIRHGGTFTLLSLLTVSSLVLLCMLLILNRVSTRTKQLV